MRRSITILVMAAGLVPVVLANAEGAQAQAGDANVVASTHAPVVPQLMRYAGVAMQRAGDTVEATFRIYASQQGGEPLWSETQRVAVSADGKFSVLLGAATEGGLQQALFAAGQGQWLAVSVERAEEGPRVKLASVAYAMKAGDAETLGGMTAMQFVTQAQLASTATSLTAEAVRRILPETTPSGSGTANKIALWTDSMTLGDSAITQTVTSPYLTGVNTGTPATTLDVNGAATVRSTLNLPPVGVATAGEAFSSPMLELGASSYDSATASAVTSTMAWKSTALGNDSSDPHADLFLMYIAGNAAPKWTGFSISPTGLVSFGAGQTFPGTGTITGVTAGTGLTGGGITGAVTVSVDTTKVPLLNTFNDFIGNQKVTGNDSVTGVLAAGSGVFYGMVTAATAGPGKTAIVGTGSSTASGVGGISDKGYGSYGKVTAPVAGSIGVLGGTGISSSANFYAEAGLADAGLWGDNSGAGTGVPVAIFGTADNAYGGAFVTNGVDYPAVYANNNSGTAIEANAAGGYGVSGASSAGIGVYGSSNAKAGVKGITSDMAAGNEGVLGVGGSTSGTGGGVNIAAGVQGDTGLSSTTTAPTWTVGVLGTTDDGRAGVFQNNSATWPTLYIGNSLAGGSGLFKTLMAVSPEGACGVGGGSLSCTGPIKSLASSGGTRTVETYAVQSPESWMEDFGSGSLSHGVAVISIDPAFAETVSELADYHVFLTPDGDCKGLYVAAKTLTGFEVRELGGGVSAVSFDFRIVAKRRGYEAQRLVDVTDHFDAEMTAARVPAREKGVKPLAAAPARRSVRTLQGRPPEVFAAK